MKRMNKGPYSCKKLKSWTGRDGVGFQFDLCEEGKKIAFIHQDGCGGATEIDFINKEVEKRLDEFLKNLPAEKCEFSGKMKLVDQELFVAALADDYDLCTALKRKCKTKTLVSLKSHNEKQYVEFKIPFSEQVKEQLVKRFGDDLDSFINEWFL